jgi:hypothetical protein
MAKIAEDGTKTSTKVEEPDKDVLLIENQIDAMNLDQNQNKSALQLEQVTETKTQPQVPDNFAKPVPNAESSATYEKYVPKKTPDFMPETKIEAKQESPVITEKMAAQYEQKRDSYHQDPTQCRINDHFYNRDFLLLMRDLVRV